MTPVLDTDSSGIITALLLTAGAGLAMTLGAALAVFGKLRDNKAIAFALGLSAGVMVYISLVELLPEGAEAFGEGKGNLYAAICFFGGMALMGLLDKFVPGHAHEDHHTDDCPKCKAEKMVRTGTILAVAIAIHNFPEGMATFISSLGGLGIALPIVIAVAIHNIPAGIAIAVPIYHGSGSRKRALWAATLSGLSSIIGAFAGMAVLLQEFLPGIEGVCLAATAGIMVYISFDELLPSSESYGEHKLTMCGVVAGMAVMAIGILVL